MPFSSSNKDFYGKPYLLNRKCQQGCFQRWVYCFPNEESRDGGWPKNPCPSYGSELISLILLWTPRISPDQEEWCYFQSPRCTSSSFQKPPKFKQQFEFNSNKVAFLDTLKTLLSDLLFHDYTQVFPSLELHVLAKVKQTECCLNLQFLQWDRHLQGPASAQGRGHEP